MGKDWSCWILGRKNLLLSGSNQECGNCSGKVQPILISLHFLLRRCSKSHITLEMFFCFVVGIKIAPKSTVVFIRYYCIWILMFACQLQACSLMGKSVLAALHALQGCWKMRPCWIFISNMFILELKYLLLLRNKIILTLIKTSNSLVISDSHLWLSVSWFYEYIYIQEFDWISPGFSVK